ncbi:hypothetical protein [Lentzea sp. NPDC003310]|uniref:hypothetical protein n=1 Tax=Lentzea sp. NPDC003310 TaxID=3154447 RepID=UPI0033B6075C
MPPPFPPSDRTATTIRRCSVPDRSFPDDAHFAALQRVRVTAAHVLPRHADGGRS